MANTYVDHTGDGSKTEFNFTFEYIRDDHVKVKVDDVIVTNYTIEPASGVEQYDKIVFNSAPANNAEIRIYRDSRGDFSPLVDFVDGSVLTQVPLDDAYRHNLFVAQEASEGTGNELLNKKGGANYDAEGNRIINLGTPHDRTDAANRGYVDDTIDTSIALGGSPSIVSLGGYDVTSTNATLKQLRAWAADIEDTSGSTVTATGSTTARTLADRFADFVNVKDFGAAGNGVADDTSEIQAAINSGAKRVYIPAGTYNHTGLSLVEDQIIYGDGVGTILHNTGSGVSVQAVGTSSNFFNGCVIRDLKLTGTASASHGIRLVDATRNNIIKNVYVADHGGDGIRLEANVGTTVDNCDIRENVGAGINITESSDYAYSSTNCVSNCHITGNDGGGVKVIGTTSGSGVYANVIKSNVIENNNVAATSGSGVIIDGAWKTDVADNAFESSFDSCILLTNASGYVSASTTISSNSFADSGSPTQVYDIDIVRGDDTLIVGNTFPASGPTASIRETAGSNLIYQANKNLTRTGTGITNVQKFGFDEVLVEKIESRGTLANTITGFRESISEKTGDYSIVQTDSGKRFTNNGAGGVVTFSLPSSAVGLSFSFTRVNASHALRIDPDGTDSIRNGGVATGGAGKYLSLDSNGGSVTICCTSSTGVWDVVSTNNGALSIEA